MTLAGPSNKIAFCIFVSLAVLTKMIKADFSLPFNCQTTDNVPCSFPFRHLGSEVNECVKLTGSNDLHCPVAVHPVSREVEEWGKCQTDSCVYACSTVKAVRCLFPFKFESSSRLEGRCSAKKKGENFQCATKVDAVTRLGLEFDECLPESCPLD